MCNRLFIENNYSIHYSLNNMQYPSSVIIENDYFSFLNIDFKKYQSIQTRLEIVVIFGF